MKNDSPDIESHSITDGWRLHVITQQLLRNYTFMNSITQINFRFINKQTYQNKVEKNRFTMLNINGISCLMLIYVVAN